MNEDSAKAIGATLNFLSLVFLVAVFIVGGTSRTQIDFVTPGVACTVSASSFEESLTARHWLAGLVIGEQPDLSSSIAKHVRKGEFVSRLSVSTRTTGTDLLAAGFTLGIYTPQTVIVRGEVVRETASARLAQTVLR